MATQLKQTDFGPIPVSASGCYKRPFAARPNIRVAFTATAAIDAAMAEVPAAIREATLDELALTGLANDLIGTARMLLSPAMYAAFLSWGEAAARFTTHYATDDEGNALCRVNAASIRALGSTPCVTPDDLAIKSFLLMLEAGDHPAFGVMRGESDEDETIAASLSSSVALDLVSLHRLPALLHDLNAAAWQASGERISWATGVGQIVVAAFADAIHENAGNPAAMPHLPIAETDGLPLPTLSAWQQAMAELGRAKALHATCPSLPEQQFNDACSALAEAQIALLSTPAPTQAEFMFKVRYFFEIDADEFCEPAIEAAIFADAARLAPPMHLAAIGAGNAFKEWTDTQTALAAPGLSDERVDELSDAEMAAARKVLAVPSITIADAATKLRVWLSTTSAGMESVPTAILADLERLSAEEPGPVPHEPYMRGPAIQWQRAYQRYIETDDEANRYSDAVSTPAEDRLQAVLDRYPADHDFESDPEASAAREAVLYPDIEARFNDFWGAVYEAREALYLLPAPGPAELAVKLKLFHEYGDRDLTLGDEIVRQMMHDARRFGRLGAFPQTDAPLLDAFATVRHEYSKRGSLPGDISSAEEDALWAGTDPATMILLETSATTIEGAIARLRHGFQLSVDDAWGEDAVVDPSSTRFKTGLGMSSMSDRMLWGAIEDLARIGGVNLLERGA